MVYCGYISIPRLGAHTKGPWWIVDSLDSLSKVRNLIWCRDPYLSNSERAHKAPLNPPWLFPGCYHSEPRGVRSDPAAREGGREGGREGERERERQCVSEWVNLS